MSMPLNPEAPPCGRIGCTLPLGHELPHRTIPTCCDWDGGCSLPSGHTGPHVLLLSIDDLGDDDIPGPDGDDLLNQAPQSFSEWWRQLAEQDLADMLPKLHEYTAADLVVMGQALQEWMPGGEDQPQRFGLEMAVAFYLLGKIARAIAAYREGRLPSEDTLKDIRIYAYMAQRIRETGGLSA